MNNTLSCKGAIFDLDGVVTRTARVHFKAWKKTFDEFFRAIAKKDEEIKFKPFTHDDDYIPFVDGKPRYEGIQSFFESREIEIPFGDPTDAPGERSICGIGNKKNEVFRQLVAKEGVDIYSTTIRFIKGLKQNGIKVGIASSSKNCKYILEKTGILDLFEAVIDGNVSKEIGLKGKPHPDIFLVTAGNLGIHPNECLMVEDSISGVKAGRK